MDLCLRLIELYRISEPPPPPTAVIRRFSKRIRAGEFAGVALRRTRIARRRVGFGLLAGASCAVAAGLVGDIGKHFGMVPHTSVAADHAEQIAAAGSYDAQVTISRDSKLSAMPTAERRTVVVHAGDTLIDIAAQYLGSPRRWRQIRDLNNIDDPRLLQVGMVLRLPAFSAHSPVRAPHESRERSGRPANGSRGPCDC